jgi:Fur family ferric uptake transcriptional regulator
MIITYCYASEPPLELAHREQGMTGEHAQTAAYGDARLSPQREIIARTASAMGSAFTVDDLAAAVRDADGSTGLATVYRAVSALEAAGTVERVGERLGSALFVYCDESHHHHHLVCTGCGRVEHAPCPLGDELLAAARQSGFTVTGHEVTLFGLCPGCAPLEGGV